METIEIDCWEVTEPDGGGVRSNHVAYFSSYASAKAYINGRMSRGDNWIDREPKNFKKTFIILENENEAEEMKKQKAIASAKAKLTKEELRLLGIE